MKVYINENLEYFIKNKMEYQSNYVLENEILDFLKSNSEKVGALLGWKNEMKIPFLCRIIHDLDFSNVAFINCGLNDDYILLERLLGTIEKNYIVIHDITKLEYFTKLASSLLSDFPQKSFLISGDHPATLLFASENELYNKIELFHFSQSFDYKNLDFEYVINSIFFSVESSGEDIPYKRLYDLFLSSELKKAIEVTVNYNLKLCQNKKTDLPICSKDFELITNILKKLDF